MPARPPSERYEWRKLWKSANSGPSSKQLGSAKVAYVEAVIALQAGKDKLERAKKLFQEGLLNNQQLMAAERPGSPGSIKRNPISSL
jgi:hypothetical protein